jgi:hypothetical protein
MEAGMPDWNIEVGTAPERFIRQVATGMRRIIMTGRPRPAALLVRTVVGGTVLCSLLNLAPPNDAIGAATTSMMQTSMMQEAPDAGGCVNRPPVVTSVSFVNGGLSATISASVGPSAPNNRLQQLSIGSSPNAAIDVRGQTLVANTTLVLPDRPQSVNLFIRRTSGTGAVTIPITAVDDCGNWPTLAGGGPDAFLNQPSQPGPGQPTSTPVPVPPTPTPIPANRETPVAGQLCPSWVHDQYVATGIDGKLYPTWHPPTDPTYKCWFGHEHGDNPAGAPALRGRSVVFDYVGMQVGADEPHAGFKVFRWDNVHHPNAPNHDGAFLLMVVHQGTSGAARFTTVHHSVVFDYYNPNDGREVHIQMMAPFGQLLVGCGANDPTMVLSQQQANVPGARQVPADKCFNLPTTPYEDWITAMYVGSDANGSWRAYVDPHFATFNSNTYCIPINGICQLTRSDTRAGTGQDPLGPGSFFKGDHREAYLNQVFVQNAGRSTTVWTDAYGKLAAANAPGSIPQYICSLTTAPQGNSAAFGSANIHDDGTVRAPN